MTTIAIDPQVKKRAAARAKQQDGLPLSAVVTILLNNYAAGKFEITTQPKVTENGFTPEFEEEVLRACEEGNGENYEFETSEEAVNFLTDRI